MTPPAVILSGARGSGKTALCRELAGVSSDYTGILCPALLDSEGREVGKSALCIAAGESWQIARVDVELDGPRLGRFSFSARGMERAVACLCAALGESSLICVIDEIGPLELDRGMGFSPVLPLLASAGRLLIVARPGLSQRISAHIPRHDTRTIVMDAGNRGETRLEIARLLRR